MARPSQTELAVLGALSTGPMTGYEIRGAITGVLGHFWHESFGQIYPALGRLESQGAVRRRAPGRTSGSVFELTRSGRRRLRALLAEPGPTPPARNALLLRLFFGAHLPDGGARDLLADAEARAAAALEEYTAVRDEIEEEPAPDPEQAYRTMTLSFGEHMARAQQAWARECLAMLEGGSRARG
ncbi:PadR family transcriptional regulator [Oryzobacter terrae]|uniref:PadR family transcriptional regulator n=1 Tax=Oryzobacter terrae TaxID=1620385 RepID=UPI00366B6E82